MFRVRSDKGDTKLWLEEDTHGDIALYASKTPESERLPILYITPGGHIMVASSRKSELAELGFQTTVLPGLENDRGLDDELCYPTMFDDEDERPFVIAKETP